MPDHVPYAELERALAALPPTMCPALLRVLVRRTIEANVFVEGGLASFLRAQLPDDHGGGNIARLTAVLRGQFQSEVANEDREGYLTAFAHRLDAAGVQAK